MPRRQGDVTLSLPVTPDERAKVVADAAAAGLSLHAWQRQRLGLEPREVANPPKAEEEMTPGYLRVKKWRVKQRKAKTGRAGA